MWEGAIGRDRHAVALAGGDHFRLVEIGMALDLVGDELRLRKFYRLIDQCDREVRDADVAREPPLLRVVERADGFLERHRSIWPVQKQKLDRLYLQLLHAFLGRALASAGGHARPP